MTTPEFYLLDLRYRVRGRAMTLKSAPLMVWWGKNNSGYANSLPWAGKYSAETIMDARDYYRLGERTLAIPPEVAERFSIPKFERKPHLGAWFDGPGPVVINHRIIWEGLEAASWSVAMLEAAVNGPTTKET